jgi:hypothetical protein
VVVAPVLHLIDAVVLVGSLEKTVKLNQQDHQQLQQNQHAPVSVFALTLQVFALVMVAALVQITVPVLKVEQENLVKIGHVTVYQLRQTTLVAAMDIVYLQEFVVANKDSQERIVNNLHALVHNQTHLEYVQTEESVLLKTNANVMLVSQVHTALNGPVLVFSTITLLYAPAKVDA